MTHLKYFAPMLFVCMLGLIPFSMAISPNNIFILGGQSNMAGRGGVEKDPNTQKMVWDGIVPPKCQPNKSILRFSANSVWEEALEPLHWDIDVNKTNGIGPGMPFAHEILAKAGNKSGVIGLVPCAIGGTHLREWVKGTQNYTRLVNRIKASEAQGGKIQGLLWYQGESDAAVEEESKFYESNLTKFYTDLRTDTNHPDLPIILVKIVTHDFFISPLINFLKDVWKAQEDITRDLVNVRIVDGKQAVGNFDTGMNQDGGHLSTKSEVKLGKMLADSFYSNFGNRLTAA